MTGYVIAEIDVLDADAYEEYRRHVPPTLAAYGARFIVRGGPVTLLEGEPEPNRIVVIEFESVERAREWWASDVYAGPKAMRQAASKGRLIAIEGVD